ncbi:MAG: hypothetical protein AAFS10_14290, partial [Myxococcota bacterium]
EVPVGLGIAMPCGGDQCISTTVTTDMDTMYNLQINAPDLGVTDALDYSIELSIVNTCAEDDAEPNDTPATAVPLRSDCRIQANVCVADQDWYLITTDNPDEEFSAAIYFFNGEGDLDLNLFRDDNGDDQATLDERIDDSRTTNNCESVTNAGATGATEYLLQVVSPGESNDSYRVVLGVDCQDQEPQLMFCE